jgi:hypothetical protein
MSSDYKTLNVTRSADDFVVTVELNRPEGLQPDRRVPPP